jgi:uncharacterized membrane protein HdeD (DUF308 family)
VQNGLAMMNPALAKIFLPWIIGAAAIFAILFMVRSAVGDDSTLQVLVLSAGVAAALALLVGFNALKKRL